MSFCFYCCRLYIHTFIHKLNITECTHLRIDRQHRLKTKHSRNMEILAGLLATLIIVYSKYCMCMYRVVGVAPVERLSRSLQG